MQTTIMMRIRLPEDLREWIEDRSNRNFRSMNKEIVAILSALRRGEEDDPEGFGKFGVTYR